MKRLLFLPLNALLFLGLFSPFAVAKDEGSSVRKVLFLSGGPSHGYGAHDHYAGCQLLSKSLNDARVDVKSTVHRNGWPADPTAFDGVNCVVLYCDGADGHMAGGHLAEMDALAKKGVGIVLLHFAVEPPDNVVGKHFLNWIGGYFETNWSVNPTWTARFSELPKHPITRGVKPFEIGDEWYYHMRFRDGMQGITPILTGLPPASTLAGSDGSRSGNPQVRAAIARGEAQHLAWAVERDDGGRGFGFTGGHVHWNWANPNFRKLVLNAIVWCARGDVPPQGVNDDAKTLADLEANPDEEPPVDFDREEIRRKFGLPKPPVRVARDIQQQFFNGENLAGWSGERSLWNVENGEIVGRSAGLDRNSFLFSDLGAGDFSLTFDVKLTSTDEHANSGVQFRSQPHEHGEALGYQADIGRDWWGKLYEESGRGLLGDAAGDQYVKTGDWNHYKIVARGSHVQTWLNEHPCVELEDPGGKRDGVFALQLHAGEPMEVRFRNLKLEMLK